MLRFLVKCKSADKISGYEYKSYYTIDAIVEGLEQALSKGGYGENGFEAHELIGVEILRKNENE